MYNVEMAEEKTEKEKTAQKKDKETGTGEESKAEKFIGEYLGKATHLFLSLLALLLLVASVIATYDTVMRDFPTLLSPSTDEYVVLQRIIANLLLIAIAAEFALLLLFHRMSAAVEVVVFVIARKTVSPNISALDLLLCAAGIAGLIILRYHYLPGRTT
jgi:flagellar biosynthesis protein FlhB